MSDTAAYLLFSLGSLQAAFALSEVREVLPRPALSQPPGMPSLLAGLVQIGREPLPVMDLAKLLELPSLPDTIDQHLIYLRRPAMLCLVDRVLEIAKLPLPSAVPAGQTFNDTVIGLVEHNQQQYAVLGAKHLLLAAESARIRDFQQIQERRLQQLESGSS